jgi:hypothetical protein
MARWTARAVRALPWPLGEQSRRRAIRDRLARLPAGGYVERKGPVEPSGPSAAHRVPPQPGPEREDDIPGPVVSDGAGSSDL